MVDLRFLTHWKGFDQSDATWEPVGNFFGKYSSDLVKYCKDHRLKVDVVDYLSPVPTQVRTVGSGNRVGSFVADLLNSVCPVSMDCHVGDIRLRFLPRP